MKSKLLSTIVTFAALALLLSASSIFTANAGKRVGNRMAVYMNTGTSYTFEVPVQLFKIDRRVQAMTIACLVSTRVYPGTGGTIVGSKFTRFSIPQSGNYSGIVRVTIDRGYQGRNLALARSYYCYLGDEVGFAMSARSREGGPSFKEEFRRKPGAPYIDLVKANLPR